MILFFFWFWGEPLIKRFSHFFVCVEVLLFRILFSCLLAYSVKMLIGRYALEAIVFETFEICINLATWYWKHQPPPGMFFFLFCSLCVDRQPVCKAMPFCSLSVLKLNTTLKLNTSFQFLRFLANHALARIGQRRPQIMIMESHCLCF